MAEPKPQKEPSMEEILASIRRIISEDGDSVPSAPATNVPPAASAADAEAVYDLTQEVDAEGNPVTTTEVAEAPVAETAKQKAGGETASKATQSGADVAAATARSSSEVSLAEDDAMLVGADAEDAAAASFAALTERMAPPRAVAETPEVPAGGRTVEQLAADLLRPMLKEWLDENLPGLVERLVKREIERIARSRRR
jgi:cell pole-organizing protein PopZ